MANGPATTFKVAITGQQCSNMRGLVTVLTPGPRQALTLGTGHPSVGGSR